VNSISATKSFQRVLVSRVARELEYGARVVKIATDAGLPVEELPDDEAVVQHNKADLPGTLQVLSIPSCGWITKADFGLLATRTQEYYLHPIIGCRFGCTYCYLLAMPHGRRPLRLYVATDALLGDLDQNLRQYSGPSRRLFCSGELADSLAELDLYPVAAVLTEYFADRDNAHLELRTKSNCVDRLLSLNHKGNTTVAFSIAPQEHIAEYEPGTASLSERVEAASKCQEAGYPIAFKFEPLILTSDWKECYRKALALIASVLDAGAIAHVSIGCLRWSEKLAGTPIFARRHGPSVESGTWIEYQPNTFNGTVRYDVRLDVYDSMRQLLREHNILAPVWWSLEEQALIDEMQRRDCLTQPVATTS
jgi:spore photoproduct lyase